MGRFQPRPRGVRGNQPATLMLQTFPGVRFPEAPSSPCLLARGDSCPFIGSGLLGIHLTSHSGCQLSGVSWDSMGLGTHAEGSRDWLWVQERAQRWELPATIPMRTGAPLTHP